MNITPFTLFALLSAPLFAEVKEEAKEITPAIVANEDAPLTVAERNYVLNSLAQTLDVFAKNFTERVDPEAPDALLLAVKREQSRIDTPLDGLSAEQREFLEQERRIYANAAQSMKGKNEDMQKEIFQTMLQTMEAHLKTASPHVKRLFGTHPLFDGVAMEVGFDSKLRAILSTSPTPEMANAEQSAEVMKRLQALAEEIRAMRL